MTENKGDLIKRNLAISYATSGIVKRIDGEDWIKTSEVKQSLNDVPTVEPETKLVANVTFNKEQLEEIVEKAKADILAQIERPQGEYVDISKLRLMTVEECAGHTIDYAMGWKACIEWIKKGGADMRGKKNG